MKYPQSLLLALPLTLSLTSCVSEEPLGQECDIEQAIVSLQEPTDIFFHAYDTLQVVPSSSDSVRFLARPNAIVGEIPLTLSLTPGATAYHENETEPFQNGTALDFSDDQVHNFRIVSEDQQWNRQYRIAIKKDDAEKYFEKNMYFDFTRYQLDNTNTFYVWTGESFANYFFTDGVWKNGNPGYKKCGIQAAPDAYPTSPMPGQGPDGSDCIRLKTCSTGAFGNMVKMKLAAGSLFNGEFDVKNALSDALAATRFGSPFKHKPLRASAWLRFVPGTKFQNKLGNIYPNATDESGNTLTDESGNPIPSVIDEPDFYIGMYRNIDENGNQIVLDGTDVITSPYIVAFARLPHHYTESGEDMLSNEPIHGITDQWQKVTLNMEYREELDPELLKNNGYSFFISFASSWQGAYFQGAVGSELWIDNIELECEY